MFFGEYQHSLDAKGRLILPARFRARLAGGVVITKGMDHCLFGYATEEWERVAEQLSTTPVSSRQGRNFVRLMFSGAAEEEPDRQGRVMIPEHLRRYAGLEKDVAVIGVGNRFEIWDRQKWEEHRGGEEQRFADMDRDDATLPF